MRTIAMRDLAFHVWHAPDGGAIRLRIGAAQFSMTATEALALADRLADSVERYRSHRAAEQDRRPQ